nr:MAG TPA: hypothetical protein [Caudoviricetes sp.]
MPKPLKPNRQACCFGGFYYVLKPCPPLGMVRRPTIAYLFLKPFGTAT